MSALRAHARRAGAALLGALALGLGLPASAGQGNGLNTSWDAGVYFYAGHNTLTGDSVLNPGNRLAGLAEDQATTELRLNLKIEHDRLRLTLRPILLAQADRNAFATRHNDEAYLSQWQLRLRASEDWSLALGREVLNWGPAQFRSPSSPFYFDNGRGNPLRELSGVDGLKLSWTPDLRHTLTLARIAGSGHDDGASGRHGWRGSWLFKADQRGDGWTLGLVAEKTPGQAAFFGMHGQYTPRDEWMLYAEAASATRADVLLPSADTSQPFFLQARSPRRATALLGAAYTFGNGQSVNLEALHDGHGYRGAEADAYFARAASSPALAGLALSHAPPLLGRDYLHLVWQSNLMDSNGYWRLMATHSVSEGGDALAGYAEYPLNRRASWFAQAQVNYGGARGEWAALISSNLTLGLKAALP